MIEQGDYVRVPNGTVSRVLATQRRKGQDCVKVHLDNEGRLPHLVPVSSVQLVSKREG